MQSTKSFARYLKVVFAQRRERDESILNSESTDIEKLEEQFKGAIVRYMRGIENGNIDTFPDMESNFALRVLTALNTIKNNGFKVTFTGRERKTKK